MKAASVLARASALFLDFDGPICSVFAGVSASAVASQLREVLYDGGHSEMPDGVATTTDPFDVLRYANSLGEYESRFIEAAFAALEVEAVVSAEPTKGAHDLIRAWRASGRPIAIVSNNSSFAIEVYLNLYDLRHLINLVSARSSSNVLLLKPSPHLILDAIEALGVPSEGCVFIGDSLSDIEAAHAASVRSIGYANKSGKSEKFSAADAVIETMTCLGLSV